MAMAGIGGVRLRVGREFEQRAHHVLYLRLFGRAGADHGLFDLPRRILEHFQILIHRRHDRDAARPPSLSAESGFLAINTCSMAKKSG